MVRFRLPISIALVALAAQVTLDGFATPAHAGVVNPDISVIGQPFIRWNDDASDPAAKRPVLDVGETEFVYDAALNPYARGTFTAALSRDGFELEEGYFVLTRGLPLGLSLKGGKYRAGFGKLNPQHPHVYPFAERFHVLAAFLPGDESLNETGVQVSDLIPIGSVALTASADWLQGDSYRLARAPDPASLTDPLLSDPDGGDRQGEPRAAGLGRLSAFIPIGDRSGLELGASGTQGTNNAAAATKTTVLGVDAKAKIWNSAQSYLVVQGEFLQLDREDAAWDDATSAYTRPSVKPNGAYVYTDYNFKLRYNVGAAFEHWQDATATKTSNSAFRLFTGLALMEETTAFRLDWERVVSGRPPGAPDDPDAVNTVTLRVIYSMGPHKAHQF
jgi:hypothetical protein